MDVLFCLFLLIFSSTCTAQNHHQLCQNTANTVICMCNSSMTQLELEDDHDGFFDDVSKITILNCGLVHLTPPSLVNAELLESLYILHSGKVILDVELPRSFSTLVIDNVTNLVELHKPLFNKRQHMKLLKIHNTTISKITKHTFSELLVDHIEFSRSRFYNLTENSIFFSDKQMQSTEAMPFHVNIRMCEFIGVPSNSIAFIGAQEVNIEKVTFAGALNETTLFISAKVVQITGTVFQKLDEKAVVISNAFEIYFLKNNIGAMQSNSLYFEIRLAGRLTFQDNVLPCDCKTVCSTQTTTVLQSIEGSYRRYGGTGINLCLVVQNNFCAQNYTLSNIIYLQKKCATNHSLYNELSKLNCTPSEIYEKKCRSNVSINSASFAFTLLAVAISFVSLKRVVFCA